jgi:predicted Zn-dependent protease with MMP-like domain
MPNVVQVSFVVNGNTRSTICGDFDEVVEALDEIVGDFDEIPRQFGKQITLTVVKMTDHRYQQVVEDDNYA